MPKSKQAPGGRPRTSAIKKNPPPPLPAVLSLPNLQSAARECKACDLWKLGTQTVFGEGLSPARIMFVGEQPGDQEDKVGHPFVGPAGRLLDEALVEAGIDRSQVFVTNVVKHFKWEAAQRGKRRIHKKPRHAEIEACRPWLDAELEVVRPEVLVCLGASAAQSLLGKEFRVTRDRGKPVHSELAPYVMATTHPASILRVPDSNEREQQRKEFVRDLKRVAKLLEQPRSQAAERSATTIPEDPPSKAAQPHEGIGPLISRRNSNAEKKEIIRTEVFRPPVLEVSRKDRGKRDEKKEEGLAEIRPGR